MFRIEEVVFKAALFLCKKSMFLSCFYLFHIALFDNMLFIVDF